MTENVLTEPSSCKKARIMVVDDDPETHSMLQKMLLLHGSEVLSFPSGSISLAGVKKWSPDLILLSAEGSDMDGFEVCQHLKMEDKLKNIPVIFMSYCSDMAIKNRAFGAGGVDYITKPVHFGELKARIAVHLRLFMLEEQLHYQSQVQNSLREVSAAQQATNFALAKLAEFRDEDTGLHLKRVSEYCRILTTRLQLDSPYLTQISAEFINCIRHASLLHDIGKVAIPDSILFKPGKLTEEEFEVMKTHTIIGADNIQAIYNHYSGNPLIGMGIEIALYHHERWDGTGYPDRLAGRNIPLSARIMAVADVYDALRSDRCYRKGFEHSQVRLMMLDGSGNHFDPVIVKAFLETESEFEAVAERIKLNEFA